MVSIKALIVLAILGMISQLTSGSYMQETLYASDVSRLRTVLESQARLGDSCSLYYSVVGLHSLEVDVAEKPKLCEAIKDFKLEDTEKTFCAVSAGKKLDCPVNLNTEQISSLKLSLKDKSSVGKLYFSYGALHAAGKVSDVKSSELVTVLKDALKIDDSPSSYGYAFHLAALLPSADAGKFVEYIEDIVAQADEVDGKYLQFEGGVFTTALVIESSLALAGQANKPPVGLDNKKIVLFANYLVSRRFTTQIKAAGRLASALSVLVKNNYFRPISVSLSPDSTTLSDVKRSFKVVVHDVLGQLPKPLVTVTIQSAKHIKSGKSLVDNKQMKMNELGVYELEMTENKPEAGLYKFSIKVTSTDKKIVGISDPIVLESRIVTPVTIVSTEIGVIDADASAATAKLNPATFPNKVSKAFEADHHQKLLMKFLVKDARLDKAMLVHQAFVRFENVATGREVIFVAEPELSTKLYKFDLSVNTKAKEFLHLSGDYKMFVVVGDASVAQSQVWHVANVHFNFLDVPPAAKKIDDVNYKLLPEIKHMFRQPEKRPAEVVSMVFCALCLFPVLVLFVLWGKLGANMSNFDFSLSSIGFHSGLAAIFGLFFCFFLHLDMFQTVKYLVLLGIPTFVFGNRVLANIAATRKA